MNYLVKAVIKGETNISMVYADTKYLVKAMFNGETNINMVCEDM